MQIIKKYWRRAISADVCEDCGAHNISIILQHIAIEEDEFNYRDSNVLWSFFLSICLPRIEIIK